MKQRESGIPFDDFRNLVKGLPAGNEEISDHTASRLSQASNNKKCHAEEICKWYSRWSGRSPIVHRPLVTLFAGTHGLQNRVDGGLSTKKLLQKVTAIAEGNADVNRLCDHHGHGLKLFDLALQMPVEDISQSAALDEKACAGTIAFGMEAIAGGSDLLTVCGISDENSLSSIAILSILLDLDPVSLAPVNLAGISDVEKAVELAMPHKTDPFEVLRRLGGRETAAVCGAILAARTERVPTIVGSLTGLAACAVLSRENAEATRHCMFSSRFGHAILDGVLPDLKLEPVMDSPFSWSMEADAVVASSLVRSACKHFPAADQATSDFT